MKRTKEMEPQILPEELLIEILLRLPVKSLIRFKSVSKSWLSLISDPQFAQLHFDSSLANTKRLMHFSAHYREMVSVDFNAPSLYDDVVRLNLPLCRPRSHIRIMGSCRGFILYLEGCQRLSVFNPSTHFHKQIPLSPNYFDPVVYNFDPFLYGFGYDPSTDDYLVTLVYGDDEVTGAQIFSLRANMWQELDGVDLSYLHNCGFFESGLYFSGAIHWLQYDFDRGIFFIVAFDLVERVFSNIAVPNDFDFKIGLCRLQEIGGYLSICAARSGAIAGGIWVLKDYKTQSSWTRKHIVLPPHTDYLAPICFTKSGDVIGRDSFQEFVKFNDKGEVLEHQHYVGHLHSCFDPSDLVLHTESLLSLPCDS